MRLVIETSEAGNLRRHEVAVFPGVARIDGRQMSHDFAKFSAVSIAGIVHSKSGIHELEWGKAPDTNSELSDALLWTGEWFGVFQHAESKEYVVTGDFFGYCPVFYTFTNDQLIVSSSLKGMSKELEKFSGVGEVNWESAHPHLVTHETMFNMRSSVESMRRDVWTLRPDEFLHVDGDRASVQRKAFFHAPQAGSFEELLNQGIERAVAQLRRTAVVHAGRLDFSISGGKDSRAVLALLLLANVAESVESYTHDPESFRAGASRDTIERDFPIALHLAQKYDLKWRKPRYSEGRRVTPEESLERFQDWRGGQCFEFRRQLVNWTFQDGPRVEISGGGGELYRSHFGLQALSGYPRWAKMKAGGTDDIREDLSLLFDQMCSPELIPDRSHEDAKRAFVNALDSGIGSNSVEVVDSFYPLQRNRYHFGQIRYARLQRQLVLYPLAQPEFFWAYNSLSVSDRRDGRMLFELMKAADPYLNAVPFEHGQWPNSFGYSRSLADVNEIDDQVLSMYKKMQVALRSPELNKVLSHAHPAASDRDVDAFTPNNIEWLIRNSPRSHVIRGLLPRIAITESLGEVPKLYMVAKLQTLVDAVSSPGSRVERLEFYGSTGTAVTKRPSELAGEREFSEVRRQYAIEGVRCGLGATNGGLDVKVDGAAEGIEVAVYLFRNGDVVQKIWYQDLEDGHVYIDNIAPMSGTYRATVFLRRKGMKNPQRVIETNMIEK